MDALQTMIAVIHLQSVEVNIQKCVHSASIVRTYINQLDSQLVSRVVFQRLFHRKGLQINHHRIQHLLQASHHGSQAENLLFSQVVNLQIPVLNLLGNLQGNLSFALLSSRFQGPLDSQVDSQVSNLSADPQCSQLQAQHLFHQENLQTNPLYNHL